MKGKEKGKEGCGKAAVEGEKRWRKKKGRVGREFEGEAKKKREGETVVEGEGRMKMEGEAFVEGEEWGRQGIS